MSQFVKECDGLWFLQCSQQKVFNLVFTDTAATPFVTQSVLPIYLTLSGATLEYIFSEQLLVPPSCKLQSLRFISITKTACD